MAINENIWMFTVMHTGTHYLWAHLKTMGYDKLKLPYQHTHISIGYDNVCVGDSTIIVTMRNPIECFRTHTYRYLRGARSCKEVVPALIYGYEQLQIVIKKYNAFVFYVDKFNQQEQFTILAALLNIPNAQYKQQPNNVFTKRKKEVSLSDGFTADQVMLFHKPPRKILELANRYGY